MNPPQPHHEKTQRLPRTLDLTRQAIPSTVLDKRHLETAESFRVHRPAPPRADDAEVRAEAIRRQTHQRRLDRWAEVRAAGLACFAVAAALAVLIVGVLVVGAMLGQWTVPLR